MGQGIIMLAALSCADICERILGYNETAVSIDKRTCRCIDIVDRRQGLPVPITLSFPKGIKPDPDREDDRPKIRYPEED